MWRLRARPEDPGSAGSCSFDRGLILLRETCTGMASRRATDAPRCLRDSSAGLLARVPRDGHLAREINLTAAGLAGTPSATVRSAPSA